MTDRQMPPTPEGCVYGPWWDEDAGWLVLDCAVNVQQWNRRINDWMMHGLDYTDEITNELLRLAKREQELTDHIRKTIELYGKPGGPWNVPGDPGGWLHEARQLVGEPSISHEDTMKEVEE